MSSTTWPAGVIARYLTVGGATVGIAPVDQTRSHTATCNGCEHDQHFGSSHLDGYYTDEAVTRMTLQDARRWAQSHAETCRAMPRPAN